MIMGRLVDSVKRVGRFLFDKETRFNYLCILGAYNGLSDEAFLKKKFKIAMGYEPDLENPLTYSEKLQWLKLHDRKNIYTQMVDKHEVKALVRDMIGEEYVVPEYGCWDHFDDIDFDALPDKFVLKCTHDSGGIYICKDKSRMDKAAVKEFMEKRLGRNSYIFEREWPYKNVKPRILAEKYIEEIASDDLKDYKFFCFDGNVPYLFVASERMGDSETKFDFFDREYNHLDLINGHPNAAVIPEKPRNFDLMLELSEKMSKGIPQVRIDFYDTGEHVYFGEFTFSHWGGTKPFEPEKWDRIFGDCIKLPTKTHE